MVDTIIIIAAAIIIAVFGVIGLGLWSQKTEQAVIPVTKRVYDSYVKTFFDEDPKTGKRTLAVLKK
jgi:hypothetical protein